MVLSCLMLMLNLFARDPVPPDSVVASQAVDSVSIPTKSVSTSGEIASPYTIQKPIFVAPPPRKDPTLKDATRGFTGPGVIAAGAITTGVGVGLVAFTVGINQQATEEWKESNRDASNAVGGTGLGLILVGVVTMGYGLWLSAFGD